MVGPTVVTVEHLPYGRDWAWYDDLHILALASHLCPQGRERALDEFQAEWRRTVALPTPRSNHIAPVGCRP